MKPVIRVAELTDLIEKQASRGVAELWQLHIVAPITRKSQAGNSKAPEGGTIRTVRTL